MLDNYEIKSEMRHSYLFQVVMSGYMVHGWISRPHQRDLLIGWSKPKTWFDMNCKGALYLSFCEVWMWRINTQEYTRRFSNQFHTCGSRLYLYRTMVPKVAQRNHASRTRGEVSGDAWQCLSVGFCMSTIAPASPISSRFHSIVFQNIDIWQVFYHGKPAALMAHPMAQAWLQCLIDAESPLIVKDCFIHC